MAITNKTKIIILSFIIASIVIGNIVIYYHQAAQLSPTEDNQTFIGANGEEFTITDTSSSSSFNPMLLFGSLGVITVLLIGVVLVARQGDKHKFSRDQQRKNHLDEIARGFESYFNTMQHYPLSTTYDSQFYTVVNLTSDWKYYNFPTEDEMRQFIPQWPLLDPNQTISDKQSKDAYLYYPRDNGQRFDLYAHLESVKTSQANNYNQIDKIPTNLGVYNYKVCCLKDNPQPNFDIKANTPSTINTQQPTPIEATSVTPISTNSENELVANPSHNPQFSPPQTTNFNNQANSPNAPIQQPLNNIEATTANSETDKLNAINELFNSTSASHQEGATPTSTKESIENKIT